MSNNTPEHQRERLQSAPEVRRRTGILKDAGYYLRLTEYVPEVSAPHIPGGYFPQQSIEKYKQYPLDVKSQPKVPVSPEVAAYVENQGGDVNSNDAVQAQPTATISVLAPTSLDPAEALANALRVHDEALQ